MRKSESFKIIDRKGTEIRLPGSTRNVQEIVAWRLNVLIQVVYEIDGTQRLIAIQNERIKQFRNAVFEA